MKKLWIITGIVLLLLIAIGVWFALSHTSHSPSGTATTTPNGSLSGVGQNNDPGSVNVTATQKNVSDAFVNQIQNSDKITLHQTIAVAPYAIQDWTNENAGGQALLRYDPSRGWVLITLGGGAWDVPSLVHEGVPEVIAQQLVAQNQ